MADSTIGFKEWTVVCEALGCGRQRVIIRKGGIAEGRAGFSFQYDNFYLFPTLFHQQWESVDWPEGPKAPTGSHGERENVEIHYAARIVEKARLEEWETVQALAPYHILKEEVVKDRFGYGDSTAIDVAVVRVFQLKPVWNFPMEKRFGGCRSWVELPLSADRNWEPVSDEEKSKAEEDNLLQLLRAGAVQ